MSGKQLRHRANIIFAAGLMIVTTVAAHGQSASDHDSWEIIVGERGPIPSGFDSGSWAVTSTQEFRGALYLGTSTDSPYGAEVWRTSGGNTFTNVVSSGFGNPDNSEIPAMVEFKGQLYVGTSNYDYQGGDSGARLWRTGDGSAWSLVSTAGFGDPDTGHLRSLAVFNGALYVGLGKRFASAPDDDYSVQIWRSFSGDPGSWERVYEETTSGAVQYVAETLISFNGYLYCVLADPAVWSYPKLRRTADGVLWESVEDFDLQCWFSEGARTTAAVHGSHLYVSSGTMTGGGLCRTSDGLSWEPLDDVWVSQLHVATGVLYAGQREGGLIASTDGLDWQETGPAEINGSVRAIASHRGELYVGSYNYVEGCELWRDPTDGKVQSFDSFLR